MLEYLRLPPKQATAYRSNKKPQQLQVDFALIVQHSSLSDLKKSRWLSAALDAELRGVPVDSFSAVRALARHKHELMREKAGSNTATALLAAARESAHVTTHFVPPEHPLLAGGDGALPGTGKTRTLTARIEYLLDRGNPPASILTLTFSNKAAQEIRQRAAASSPTSAPELWCGTFHAFGLELVRKFGDLVGIVQPIRLLDQADQLVLLEQHLTSLELDHYLRLHEPSFEL